MRPDEVTEQSKDWLACGCGVALIYLMSLLAAVFVGVFTPANYGGCPMKRLSDFFSTWRLYCKHHSLIYAARRAYGIAFRGLPF
mgnify:CR=1 FL=1